METDYNDHPVSAWEEPTVAAATVQRVTDLALSDTRHRVTESPI